MAKVNDLDALKIYSANLMNTANGQLLSVRWIGTDEEITHWKALGLVPIDAEEVVGLADVSAAALARVQFDLLPVTGRVLM
jgi:hypothetical protein